MSTNPLRLFSLFLALAGRDAVAIQPRPAGFNFDRASGLTNRILTPNGDRLNDWAVFRCDNPRGSEVSGRVYDLKGAVVSALVPGPLADSLMWDGRSNGRPVPSGVYLYFIEAEGRAFTGTLLVLR